VIVGSGVDLIEIRRVEEAIARRGERLLERLFTARERALFPPGREFGRRAAGRLAAKEAVLKALGTGLSGCRWRDVEVLRDACGGPVCQLSGGAARTAARLGVTRVTVSISHGKEHAVASALALAEGGDRVCD